MKTIDLNCDLGEGFNNEPEIMPHISSCNIACGYHAGDDEIIRDTIDLAIAHDVIIGAHPSFDDRENFGRVDMQLTFKEIEELVSLQIIKVQKLVSQKGARLNHVKPHGALYNMAARSNVVSEAIVSGIKKVDANLKLMGMAKSEMESACIGSLSFIAEGFADRRYLERYKLLARKNGGLLDTMQSIEEQLENILLKGKIKTSRGLKPIQFDSICVHGDTPGSAKLIPKIAKLIKLMGYQIQSPYANGMV